MTDDDDFLRSGIGGNQPPDRIAELRAELTATHEPLAKRAADLVGMRERLPARCDDQETADKLADGIKAAMAFQKNSEAARVSAKEPWLAGERAVDGFFKSLSDPVADLKAHMAAILDAHKIRVRDAERRRLEAIAAEQRRVAAEAEAKARREAAAARKAKDDADALARAEQAAIAFDNARAARAAADKADRKAEAPSVDLTRSRSDLGSVSSLRAKWDFRVENADAVPRKYLAVSETAVNVAIKAATTKEGRCELRIPGILIYDASSTVVR